MRVEKIELIGFKSFAEKTAFNLHTGITCIVGPNGCGKSNVVDAFKWVLGEQSAKSLRGDKMEEVIFVGSQAKKPKGMCEVTLSVSGLGSSENGRETPTLVTRRLYRSGESDYMLNRASCRLLDIRDIFLDTGLDIKSYSILEQDRIAAILSARPDERRFIIEEVAGVVKYKVRRGEAQSKLESSRANLQRINDIVLEVRRQIGSLERQVRRAERYRKLMGELRELELRTARRDFTVLSGELREVLRLYEGAKEEDSLLRAEFARREAGMEAGRIGLVEKEKALEAVQAELQEVERRMAELERSTAVSAKEREHLKENIVKLRREEEENTEKRAAVAARNEEMAASGKALEEEVGALAEEMDARAGLLKAVKGDIDEKERLLDRRRRDSFGASEELGSLRNELQRYTALLDSLREKERGLNRELAEFKTHMDGTEAEGRELEAAMLDGNSELMAMKEERGLIEDEVGLARQRLEALGADTARAREEMASASSRLESIREMVFADSSGEALREDIHILACIADVFDLPREYERAVESALRETISGFIPSTYAEVRRGVDALKAREMGRTAFIPADVEERPALAALPEGAIARASDVVKAREGYERVVRNMLGNVAIVRDLEGGLSLDRTPMTLVTMEGEIIEPSGAVVAGRSRGILALKRRIRELTEEIEVRGKRLEALEAEAAKVQAALGEREDALAGLSERVVETERELSLLRLRAEKNLEEVEREGRKQAFLKIEMEEVRKEQETSRGLIEEKEGAIARQEKKNTLAEEALVELREETARLKTLLESRSAESVELGLRLNSSRERAAALGNEERSITRLLAELDEKEGLIGNELAATDLRVRESAAEAEGKEEALMELAVRADELSGRISEKKEVITGESAGLTEVEREMKALRQRIDGASQGLSNLDVRRAEQRLRIENIRDNIRGVYGVELEEVEAGEVTPEDEERLPVLRDRIESLGPVSLGSIEEHEELKGRFEFLTGQKEDLEKSIAELEEAIARINTTTRKRLSDAYEALRLKFSEVFVRLFGGGRAELVLTDERNILETGIDIVAQPPGKKLQNILLLSGGEKTLTALALLFAGFLLKPTPLCILDEADAALDEANTHKFAEMIRDLARDIQFIVVTHNRVTMEAANYIYGITMEEPGNSKAISMEMAEA